MARHLFAVLRLDDDLGADIALEDRFESVSYSSEGFISDLLDTRILALGHGGGGRPPGLGDNQAHRLADGILESVREVAYRA